MLILPLHAGGERYGVPCRDVIEVVPSIPVRKVPHAPPHLLGLFSYRGAMTPVIDLARLLIGVDSIARLSTRVVLVRAEGRVVGIRAEGVTEPIELPATAKGQPIMAVGGATYFGEIVATDGSSIHMLRVEGLLGPELRGLLLPTGGGT
jgi:chemotaxis-related protein WspB